MTLLSSRKQTGLLVDWKHIQPSRKLITNTLSCGASYADKSTAFPLVDYEIDGKGRAPIGAIYRRDGHDYRSGVLSGEPRRHATIDMPVSLM